MEKRVMASDLDMCDEALRMLLPYLRRIHWTWISKRDPKWQSLYDTLPKSALLTKLSVMLSDEREHVKDLSGYRPPFMNAFRPEDLTSSYASLIGNFGSELRSYEMKALSEWGPPYNTSYAEYYDGRLRPHYDSVQLRVTDGYLDSLEKEQHEDLHACMPMLQLSSFEEVWDRRNRQSNLGPQYMCSVADLPATERAYLHGWLLRETRKALRDPDTIYTCAMPGTRISQASPGSEAEDYNRVILMVDVRSYVLAGLYVYPFMRAMKTYPSFQCVYGYRPVQQFVQENSDKYFYLSCDTSRMDHAVKWDPYGGIFCRQIQSFFPSEMSHFIRRIIWSIHNPMIFVPDGIMGGSIGNASGSTDTTIKNCLTSDLLGRHYERKFSLPRGSVKRWFVGDDALLAIPKRLRSYLPDNLNQSVVDAWADLGFKAKPEKQLAGDTALFLKRYYSASPSIGQATMVGANVIKKMVWDRQMKYEALYGTYSLDEDEADLSATLARLFNCNDRFEDHVKHYEGRRVLPSKDATWPYYVTDERVLDYFRDWRGPLGPLLETDIRYFRTIIEDNRHLHPDRLRSITVLQQLSQIRWHPHYEEIVRWISDHLNAKTVLLDVGLLTDIVSKSGWKAQQNPFSLTTPALMARAAISLWAQFYGTNSLKRVLSSLKTLYIQFNAISSGEVPASEYNDSINAVLSKLGYECRVSSTLSREKLLALPSVDLTSPESICQALGTK